MDNFIHKRKTAQTHRKCIKYLKELNPTYTNLLPHLKLGDYKQGNCLLYFPKCACLEDERAKNMFQF